MPGTPAPTAPTTRAPLSAYLLMVAVGLALAAGLGTIASVLREQQPALTFAVFSMTLLPACLGVSWLILVAGHTDRKSTRLNSSHVAISYAVFCSKTTI